MLTHYLKVFFRDLARNKVNSIINLTGLVIGLTLTFLLLLYTVFEVNYDKHNKNYSRIFRVVSYENLLNRNESNTPYPLAPKLKALFPEVEDYARVQRAINPQIKMGEEQVRVLDFFCADNSIFSIFTIPIENGNSIDPITNPNTVAMCRSWAKKVFGDADPIGKNIDLFIGNDSFTLTVTAVYSDLPKNSSFLPGMIANSNLGLSTLSKFINYSDTLKRDAKHYQSSFDEWWFTTFLLLKDAKQSVDLTEKIASIKSDIQKQNWDHDISLQPMRHFHFSPVTYIDEDFETGNIVNVYIYAGVGLLILIIAIANYLILSLARSSTRLKEYGLRKVVGGSRSNLIFQTIRESFLFILLSLPLTLTLVEVLLPFVNNLFYLEMEVRYLDNLPFLIGMVAIVLVTGILSSLYLALVASNSNPIQIFSKSKDTRLGGIGLMRVLVVVQLVIFISLISTTFTIYQQIQFMQNRYLGFDKENLISFNVQFDGSQIFNPLREELLKNPDILGVTGAMWAPPTNNTMDMSLCLFGKPETEIKLEGIWVDHNFTDVLGIKLIEGEAFNESMNPNNSPVLANKALVEKWELTNPIGTKLSWGTIVGVVENFHVHSMHREVAPALLYYRPNDVRSAIVRFKAGKLKDVIEFIDSKWKTISPDKPLMIKFFDDELGKLYTEEKRFSIIVVLFSILSIFIAAMGLFGLSLFLAERRTKEIGVRKVLGASNYSVVRLMFSNFVMLVFIAGAISTPIAVIFAKGWLANFAYRINLNPWIYLLSAAIALAIVTVTLSFQTLRVARKNPVDSLRYE
jgi:putative ABC transport system permease protein